MLLNVSQLLADNHTSDTVKVLLVSQHAVLLPINLFAGLLNAAAFSTVIRSAASCSVREVRLASFAFIECLCGVFGFGIDLLYLVGDIPCSANCELTFDPGEASGPEVKVTILRYCMYVLRAAHYCYYLLNSMYNWILFVHPLQFQRFSRHRHLYMSQAGCWLYSLVVNIFILVDGLKYHSDTMFFTFRAYAVPVLHTFISAISFGLHYNLARVAVRQIRETSKLADLQARLHPGDNFNRESARRRSHSKKNLHVFFLFILMFGTFLITTSPGIYYRAFRIPLPPTLGTVATLLALDVLPSLHYICTFILTATKNPVVRTGLQEYVRSVSRFLCCENHCF
ncbi:hypothetical protein RRG08_015382 [Elysia crispata]|uniref:G protein-coupled receptor n=1 Tax=Elysia crispata TaxID=231223 RepID=A0AAE1D4D7_9GAST|nr:hypothetical protein RRG08_015382 [Elysia crispata]